MCMRSYVHVHVWDVLRRREVCVCVSECVPTTYHTFTPDMYLYEWNKAFTSDWLYINRQNVLWFNLHSDLG